MLPVYEFSVSGSQKKGEETLVMCVTWMCRVGRSIGDEEDWVHVGSLICFVGLPETFEVEKKDGAGQLSL